MKTKRIIHRYKVTLAVFWQGVQDGWRQPFDLTSGMTYPIYFHNECYDTGANVGQFAGKILNRNSNH